MKRWLIGIVLVMAVVVGVVVSGFAQNTGAQNEEKLSARLDEMAQQMKDMDQKLTEIQDMQNIILQEVKKVIIRVHRS